jgi:SAM-dependent methyltransferase
LIIGPADVVRIVDRPARSPGLSLRRRPAGGNRSTDDEFQASPPTAPSGRQAAYVSPPALSTEPSWGIWGVPESEAQILPEVAGLDTIELGCGTAYVSAWLARRGARPVGVDITPAQLETARALQREHGLDFPLLEASAEAVPLPDASFDLAISEYGAALWCDPYRWIPAARLAPSSRLVLRRTPPPACSPDEGPAGPPRPDAGCTTSRSGDEGSSSTYPGA